MYRIVRFTPKMNRQLAYLLFCLWPSGVLSVQLYGVNNVSQVSALVLYLNAAAILVPTCCSIILYDSLCQIVKCLPLSTLLFKQTTEFSTGKNIKMLVWSVKQ